MYRATVAFGNFIFRWRDTVFTLIFLPSMYLLILPELAVMGDTIWDHAASLMGVILAGWGMVIRAATIGLGFVKRSGVSKKIHADGIFKEGFFSHMRNPLYLGNIMIATGAMFVFNMYTHYAILLPFFLYVYIAITLAEEKHLREKFGQAFDEYCREVPNRFFPGDLKGMRSSMQPLVFSWKRYFKREYSSTAILTASLLLAVFIKLVYRHDYDTTSSLYYALLISSGFLIGTIPVIRLLAKKGMLEWKEYTPVH